MTSRFVILFARGLVASASLAIYFGASAHAATITVNTTATTGSVSDCTILDAVDAANTNLAVNGCIAGDAEPAVDTINLPAGVIDLNTSLTFSESVIFQGAGMNATTLSNSAFYSDWSPTSIGQISFKDLTLANAEMGMYSPLAAFNLDHVRLDAVMLYSASISDDMPLNLNFTNVNAINNTYIDITQSSNNPGNVLVKNSTFTGDASVTPTDAPAIVYRNDRANSRLDIENSIITGYTTGIQNQECSDMVWSPFTLYVTDSMIGGAGMQTGIVNNCGHLVINRSTFHDIDGTAIVAWANYQAVDQNTNTCSDQVSSRLEVYNSTFSSINVNGSFSTVYPIQGFPYRANLVTPYIGIITVDSQLNPTCTSGSQTTDTDITLVHNTFANNTFTTPNSAVLGLRDGTVLRNLRVQNNAFEGNAFGGDFSAAGTASVTDNLTTESYAGPAAFVSGFTTVADFMLGPLQDNGGALIGVDQGGGSVLTMRPLAGSPLIDAASFAGLASDQRGTARSLMIRYDAGAVEVTEAEFTADGGVYTPSRLAETGDSLKLFVIIGGCFIASGILSIAVRSRC